MKEKHRRDNLDMVGVVLPNAPVQIVNYVGVQCEVKEEAQDAFRERLRKIPLPEELMRDENDEDIDDM